MSRSKAVIQPTVLAVYVDNLKKLSDNKLDVALCRLQDVIPDEAIGLRELPVAVPEIVRRVLAAKSRQASALLQEVEEILATLEDAAEQEQQDREDAAEAALPHCEKCGTVLQPKKRRK